MTPRRLLSLSIVLSLLFCSVAPRASAAGVLQGMVVEVVDGETFMISSDNRVAKIRLFALSAPKNGHQLASVSRQHLAALIQGKSVTIRYMWVDQAAGAVVGYVILEGVDIGLQMIRDGAAWYNKNYENSMDAESRRVYVESESAARGEKRGVWDEAIVRSSEAAAPPQVEVKPVVKAKPVVPQVTSADRAGEREKANAAVRRRTYGSEAAGEVSAWTKFQPEDEEFSIRMPSYPKITTRKFNSKGKPMVERTYVSMGPNSDRGRAEVSYIVSSVTLPVAPPKNGEVTIKRQEFDQLMFKMQESFQNSIQSIRPDIVLTEPREVISGLHIGREFAIEDGYGSPMGRVRFFATSRHIYLIGYVKFTYKGIAFLDSFELKDDNKLIIQ